MKKKKKTLLVKTKQILYFAGNKPLRILGPPPIFEKKNKSYFSQFRPLKKKFYKKHLIFIYRFSILSLNTQKKFSHFKPLG